MVDFETPISIIDVSIDFIVDTTTLSDNSKSGVRGRVVIIYWSYSSGFDMVGLVDMSWVKKYIYFFLDFFFNAIAWSWEDSFFCLPGNMVADHFTHKSWCYLLHYFIIKNYPILYCTLYKNLKHVLNKDKLILLFYYTMLSSDLSRFL